ncbi:hypothetical protein RDABS01_005434, partial [Bienertia sinuspersici]
THCACGLPVAKRTSWNSENPGRKFLACKFYNHETGHKGCNTFEWINEDILDWQRDVTNMLVVEKHRLIDKNMLKSRLVCESHKKDRLSSDLLKMKDKASKQKGTRVSMVRNEGVPSNVFVCAIVSVAVSSMVMKLFG